MGKTAFHSVPVPRRQVEGGLEMTDQAIIDEFVPKRAKKRKGPGRGWKKGMKLRKVGIHPEDGCPIYGWVRD